MLPTFLGIGAQRTGTTRLHYILRAHPDIAMPEKGSYGSLNELHYFDRACLSHDLSWYSARLEAEDDRARHVCGEITPSYATLSRRVVRHIRELIPDLKVVFVLRHPVERLFSAAKAVLTGFKDRRALHLPSAERLAVMCTGPSYVLRNDYERTIDIWTSAFGRDALFVGLFEEQ